MLSDVNGEYPAMESAEIRTAEGNRYTVFSLWDTYRNLHQLLTLVYPDCFFVFVCFVGARDGRLVPGVGLAPQEGTLRP